MTETTEQEPVEEPPKESGNAEAARYRTRLRETETERDSLRSTLDTYRRRDAELAAEAAGMAKGSDIFVAGTELESLLADDGTVDDAKVKTAAAAVLAERPHWATPPPPKPKPDASQGQMSGKQESEASWSDVISARNK